jgi:pSer/pThr/pTyr-binding forkhead associated (FHA) protein
MKCPACGDELGVDRHDCPGVAVAAGAPTADHLELPDGTKLALEKETVTFGRGSGNDHVLTDVSISRRHARLQRLPNGWLLIDLGSSNGTWVNGDKVVVPYLLQDGDQILFGEQPLVFRVGAPGAASTPGKRARVETVLGRSAFGLPAPPPAPERPSEHPTGEHGSIQST